MGKHSRWFIAALATLGVCLVAGPARAIVCTATDGPPGAETTVTIDITDPPDGTTVPATAACSQQITVSGTWNIDAPPPLYDFYIVIDASGSTGADSGADVDGDGVRFEYDDNIYCAEIEAARQFILAIDPTASRVAIFRFQSFSETSQPLTADMAAALATLDRMKLSPPGGGTAYVAAMRAMENEVIASGDRVNREQRCIFLSDGQPNETLAAVHAEALNVAALGVRMDTFALGFTSSAALEDMAATTDGIFTALATPGDIVDLLPSFVPGNERRLESLVDTSGTVDTGDAADSGTFTATVTLVPGANLITMTLYSEGRTPVSVQCSITVFVPKGFTAEAGPPQTLCRGQRFTLDGSASNVSSCALPLYRWMDCNGAEICPLSPNPLCELPDCGDCGDFMLEVSCEGEACTTSAMTPISCNKLPEHAPTAQPLCGPSANLACGADPTYTSTWDLDPAVDSDGDGDPVNDADAPGCDIPVTFPSGGTYRVNLTTTDDLSGCLVRSELSVTVLDGVVPRDVSGGLCPNVLASFSCGTPDPASAYWWDFDESTDSDSNGDATDDHDAEGCDASTSWPVDGAHVVSGWQLDGNGCRWLVAQGTMDITGGAIPGETLDLRVAQLGDAVALSWSGVPGASSHRVLRGTIASLWDLRLYDHAADDAFGQGACDAAGLTAFTDPDDAADGLNYYYLITAISPCGGEGRTGDGFDGSQLFARPDRIPTASCP